MKNLFSFNTGQFIAYPVINGPLDIQAMREKMLELNEKQLDIINRAEAEEREPSDDEIEEIKAIENEIKRIEKIVNSIEAVADRAEALRTGQGRKTEPNNVGGSKNQASDGSRRSVVTYAPDRGKWGFNHLGEFAVAVKRAHPAFGNILDPRIAKNAPTTYGTEQVGADGGFAVPPDFRTEIMQKVLGEESLLGRCDQLFTGSNAVTFPKDETTPWASSGGIQAYWEGEARQFTESKPALESETYKLNKLTALVPVSDELLDDAPGLDSYLRRKVPQKFDWKLQNAIVNGTGAGQPTGILVAGCTVSVEKESGQAADTVVFENISNMWARMYGPCRRNAIWLINQDIEPQLDTMSFEGTSSSVPVYLPANGLAGTPFATLKGRPVVPVQACQTLGDKGDIILADLTQYMAVLKTGGTRIDVSIHLYFDYDLTAYRFILRIAGQPWWRSSITPANSSNALSCFVTLAERA